MNSQTVVVLAIVALAFAFVARRAWQQIVAARRPKTGCGPDCGCGS